MYFDIIAKIVAERTGCDVSAVKPESTFSELGIDSLDTVELISELEDRLDIDFGEPEGLETMGDIVAYIDELKA